MNPINARDLKYLPTFSLAHSTARPVVRSGTIGKVYGFDLFVSNVVSAGTAYLLSTGQNLSGSYAPIGFFVIKRPLLSDLDVKKEFDAVDVSLNYQVLASRHMRRSNRENHRIEHYLNGRIKISLIPIFCCFLIASFSQSH